MELVTLFDGTADAIGGEWTIGEHEGEERCNFDEGVEGRPFAAWRSAPPVDDLQAAAEEVQGVWQDSGYDVTIRFTPDPDVYEVVARGSNRFVATFGTSAETMTLRGASACVKAK
ncbi:hypothetical protein [Salinibacterium sp. SWN1162]|uniref:hypothetical protein n=1 Tax=Salinibacterium sp. SWN1162 TaxID=2792053 RepID=UPI0018CEE658|nr:hypothetical protein [Salinibacterium sp. SWN1162]MBH0008852.1 hypothetical protein [Salinibacterium sp. SWN1162]